MSCRWPWDSSVPATAHVPDDPVRRAVQNSRCLSRSTRSAPYRSGHRVRPALIKSSCQSVAMAGHPVLAALDADARRPSSPVRHPTVGNGGAVRPWAADSLDQR